jgi:hypothetical protein
MVPISLRSGRSKWREGSTIFGAKQPASGAVSPVSQWSIPNIRAKFPHFGLKVVEHSRYLPDTTMLGPSAIPLAI